MIFLDDTKLKNLEIVNNNNITEKNINQDFISTDEISVINHDDNLMKNLLDS